METTEAVEWSLSQLRMGDDNAALRPPSPAAGPAPKEHASTSEFPCARHGHFRLLTGAAGSECLEHILCSMRQFESYRLACSVRCCRNAQSPCAVKWVASYSGGGNEVRWCTDTDVKA